MLSLSLASSSLVVLTPIHAATSPTVRSLRTTSPRLGLFDGLFGETPEQKAAKDAEFKAMQEMMERRRNPEKMAAYNAEVDERRAKASAKDAELKELQKGGGAEALEQWQELRKDGKINVFDKEREAGDRSLGGEGLLPDRIDESMPYIDSGYVDESVPDVMEELKAGFGKLFGGDKK